MFELRRSPAYLAIAVLSFLPLSARAVTVVGPPDGQRLAADANEDIEPALVTQMRGSDEYTVVVNMKFQTRATDLVSTLVATVSYPGGIAIVPIPGAGDSRLADPVLAKDDGAPGQPIYLVALGETGTTTALRMWTSTNGGLSWSAPSTIATASSVGDPNSPDPDVQRGFRLDKPSVTAGVPTGPRLTRMMYVAYLVAFTNTAKIAVRSSSSGIVFSSPVIAAPEAAGLQAPTVLADTQSSTVYVLWARPEGIHVKSSSSTYPQLAFGFGEWAVLSGAIMGTDGSVVVDAVNGVHVKAVTVPIARFDSVHKRLSVAWHERVGNNARDGVFTKVRFAASLNGRPWQAIDITNGTSADLQPSFDLDSAGNALLTFYRFGVTTPDSFQQYGTYITFPDQLQPQAAGLNPFGAISPDIRAYSAVVETPNGPPLRLLGEYHDVGFSNGTFKNVAIVIGANNVDTWGDPWLWKLIP